MYVLVNKQTIPIIQVHITDVDLHTETTYSPNLSPHRDGWCPQA